MNINLFTQHVRGLPGGSDGIECACNAGDLALVPGLGRSVGEGNGYPLQYSCLENSVDRGAWRATVHGVAKSQIWLGDFHLLPWHVYWTLCRQNCIDSLDWLLGLQTSKVAYNMSRKHCLGWSEMCVAGWGRVGVVGRMKISCQTPE